MNRNIDLIRYRKYEHGLLLLEQLTSTTTNGAGASAPIQVAQSSAGGSSVKGKSATVMDNMARASPQLRELYEQLKAYLIAQGDDVAVKTTVLYIAFRRMRNYVTVDFRSQLNKLLIYARIDPSSVELADGFTRDMTGIGHSGAGDLEISIASTNDLERAKPLLDRAYNEG